ncbi:MAG: GNAT family N-acetyltransferase [Nocardioides sp.]
MELREFGPDDATAVRSFVDVKNAGRDVDAPWRHLETPYRFEMEMRHGWDGEVSRYFLAEAGGEAVGGLEVATSEYDNLDLAWLGIDVHPAHRRRGYGTALLEAS